MGTRRTRRYKMRRPLFAFGQLMLPLVGIVALGLLVVGVKLFFLPGENGGASVLSSEQDFASEKDSLVALPGVKPTPTSFPKTANPTHSASSPNSPETMQIAVPVTHKDQIPQPRNENTSKPVVRSPVTSPSSAPPPTFSGTSFSWGVQVGAFTKRDQAVSLMTELQKIEINVLITTGTVNGKTYYRVRVAAGQTRQDAEKLERKLRQKGYPTLIVHM